MKRPNKTNLPALIGLLAGVTVQLSLGRALSSVLFGVQPHDGVTLLGVVVIVTVVAGLAAYVPARRAAGDESMRLLRID